MGKECKDVDHAYVAEMLYRVLFVCARVDGGHVIRLRGTQRLRDVSVYRDMWPVIVPNLKR
jgi:hypothetical protein